MTQVADTRDMTLPQAGNDDVCGTCSEFCRQHDSIACVAVARHRAVRWWLAAVGVACVALGAIGAVVPGLPTTVFLIIASWCFVRSCPLLERVLIRNRFFAPFVRYLQPGAVMPTRARVISTAAMWCAVSASAWFMTERGAPSFVVAIVLLAAVIGTVAVWRVARAPRPATA